MTKIERLIDMFGGKAKLADAAGCDASLVTRWIKRGAMPSRYNSAVAGAARSLKLDTGALETMLDAHVCPHCGAPLEPGGDTATVTG